MALAVAACEKSPTESSGDRLTQQEAAAIMATVQASGDGAFGRLGMQSGQMAVNSPPTVVNVEHESDHPCPQGGRVAIQLDATFEFDEAAQSASIDAEGSLTHNDCAVRDNGITFSVDGDPNIAYELHARVVQGVPSGNFSSSANGAFDWTSSDGRSGRCVIDFTDVTDFQEKKRTVEGEVCGHSVRQVTSWT